MEILQGVSFYICIAIQSSKSVSLLKYMIVTSTTNAITHVIHAGSDEPN